MKPIIRSASLLDSSSIWYIRNQSHVRKNSHSGVLIKWSSHQEWYIKYLKVTQNKFFILEDPEKKRVIGYCRYDFYQNHFLISIAIDTHYQQKGYASLLLSETLSIMNKYHLAFRAEVKKNNFTSRRLFEKHQFKLKSDEEFLHYYRS